MGVIQHVRLTPLILEAEKYENAGDGHSHDHAAARRQRPLPNSQPRPRSRASRRNRRSLGARRTAGERTLFTTARQHRRGCGVCGRPRRHRLLTGCRSRARNGLLWGLAGFLAVNLAPAAGLSPELPGMPAGDLLARQVWWVGTIIATGIAHLSHPLSARDCGRRSRRSYR